MHPAHIKSLEDQKKIQNTIQKFLYQEEFKNETGGKAFIDLQEESYRIRMNYDHVSIHYHDKRTDNITEYTLRIGYQGISYINKLNNDYMNIYKDFDMLLIYCDRYFKEKQMQKQLKHNNTKKKYTTDVFKI